MNVLRKKKRRDQPEKLARYKFKRNDFYFNVVRTAFSEVDRRYNTSTTRADTE